MPDEPNKKMDEMLRAYAEERRKVARLELHPATRKLLQGEVTRIFGRAPESRPWWKGFRAFWPQIAFGSSLCLVLGIAVFSLRQPPSTEQKNTTESSLELSDNLPRSSEEKKLDGMEAQMRQQPPSTAEKDRTLLDAAAPAANQMREPAPKLTESRERTKALTANSSVNAGDSSSPTKLHKNESAPVGERATLARPPAEVELLSKEKTQQAQPKRENARSPSVRTDSLATAPPVQSLSVRASASTPAREPSKSSTTAELSNLGAARRLNFVQLADANSKAGAAASIASPVLTSFQVEQFGTNVRFLDRDGSVYVGVLEATNALATLGRKEDSAQAAGPAYYSFRAQGTNLTLGTELLFTGQYFEATNTAIAPPSAAQVKNQADHLIIGNATFGATNQVPVRAVSSGP